MFHQPARSLRWREALQAGTLPHLRVGDRARPGLSRAADPAGSLSFQRNTESGPKRHARDAGQVIGSTTPDGGYAGLRPVHYKEVAATLYRNLGIDVHATAVTDSLGRPHYLLDGHEPVKELI